MFKTIQSSNIYIIYNSELIDDVSGCFDENYWQKKNAIIGCAQGRGTTWFIQLPLLQAALRHYRRGGLFGKVISDSYFFIGYNKTRSIAEFHLLNHLKDEGVNVPTPIAARVVRNHIFYQADLLSEKISNASDLVGLLQERRLTKQEYFEIGKEIKKLHQSQVNHTDLNIHNILLDTSSTVWIIDFDKCYQQDGEGWKEANINRLLRSFRKEVKKRAIHWDENDWEPLFAGYKANIS
ncbi:3-deoxy-D-manno-octulosonic acid kinase [Psychromonas algicola]|uniref:3-deoxy-D-manno-octulosonic acid kinase n=1 Tax=Psychromonas algicola TaxID=2555642 RepID=UPI001067F6AD|nr:3-deoxy-D-manno-octulosonic acid kinase [Psychromonas sp. RZ5]TEW51999.1 3-deoxy-D-manno-octulosonic acid kinase [Psychromonas sp. RZ5]